jgi:hypothetical protein
MVTKEPEALEYAARAFRSIEVNYSLGEQAAEGPSILMQRAGSIDPNDRFTARAGWICKPYGQVMTTQTSTEQNFGPVWGLHVYRQFAPPKTKARIDSMIVNIADLWMQMGYKINFFGENWEFGKSMPRAQRHMPVWAWVNRVAYTSAERSAFCASSKDWIRCLAACPLRNRPTLGWVGRSISAQKTALSTTRKLPCEQPDRYGAAVEGSVRPRDGRLVEVFADRHARRFLRLLLHRAEYGDGRVEASAEIDQAAAVVEQPVHVAERNIPGLLG